VPLVPIATFLTGSLLSLLLPTLLLIALVVWYVRFIGRAPGPAELTEPARPATNPPMPATTPAMPTTNPASSASPEAVPPPTEG
jgi:hypothetical protein